MHKKDFDSWNQKKAALHKDKERPFFHMGEVWFCSLGTNIGFEQDGRGKEFLRPIVIIKQFNNEVLWALPLTKNQKKGQYYFSFELDNTPSTAILSQIRLIDSKRLQYKIGTMSPVDFAEIKKRLRKLLI